MMNGFFINLPLAAITMSFCLGCGANGSGTPEPTPAVDLVDPFIGSGGHYFGFGSAFMGACRPHGMAKPGPDTSKENGAAAFHHFSGYHFDDDYVHGFSQVHIHGTGAPDYGALLLMPTSGFSAEKTGERGYRSRFSKSTEQAEPGYYAVTLDDHGIRAELTATERCGLYRFSYAADETEPVLIVDPSHALPDCEVADAELAATETGGGVHGWLQYQGALTGRSGGFRLYYEMRFSRPAQGWTAWVGQDLSEGSQSVVGPEVGMAFSFSPNAEPLLVTVGLSYVDLDGARANLAAEIPDRDFERVRDEAREAWAAELARVEIQGGTGDEQEIFYTAVYHAFLTPTLFTDVDGRYTGFDEQIHQAEGFTYYTDFSLWDTYRTVHPLFVLVAPDRQRDMVESLLAMYRQGGHLPKWPAGTGYTGCMIGTPADVTIADTYIKGITDFDVETAYDAVVANATTAQPSGGRAEVERYVELGYLPADEVDGSAARTLEFGVADAAIAAWAAALGRADDAAAFAERSGGYRHLWDPELRFLRGRNADGAWFEGDSDFNELDWNAPYYVEGNAWHYLWLVPHDPAGLAELFGSAEAMAEKLEAFFATPEPEDPLGEFLPPNYYWHGNEPDIHAAYLFDELGRPERTQHWVRHVLATRYGAGPDGLAGNDDCGTLSSWYVFSASGFYPSAGQTRYWIGSPVFERVVFHLGDDRTFEIEAKDASAENLYIQAARLNGQDLDRPWFEHGEIAAGGELVLQMGPEPSGWGR